MLPDSVGGLVCDVAAVVAIVADVVDHRSDGVGWRVWTDARERGLTLAVPAPVVGRAATVYLGEPARRLLAAWLLPAGGGDARDVWWLITRRPSAIPGYPELLGRCGDPVTAVVAAYAAATGWPVVTDTPGTYAELLGRADAVVVPALPTERP